MEINRELQEQIIKTTNEFHKNIMPLLDKDIQKAVQHSDFFNIEVVGNGPTVKLITKDDKFDITKIYLSVYKLGKI